MLDIILFFHLPLSPTEQISVFGQYSQLIGEFYNNRLFAYSFVYFILRQYYGSCDLYSANGRSTVNDTLAPILLALSRPYRFTYYSGARP
jgi:hypothetical protein